MQEARTPLVASGKVELWEVSTGARLLRWPVDARELLATGAYTTDPPSASAAVPVDGGSEHTRDAAADSPVANEPSAMNEMDADALVAATEVTAGVEYADPIPSAEKRRGRPPRQGK